MQIGCTKKLIGYLDINPSPCDTKINPLFSFSANLITLNRRNCIVITNEASSCGFIIYGFVAKDKSKIRDMIIKGIQNMLKAELYSDEIIVEYLEKAGEIVFTPTRGRSAVARLNKYCQRVGYFSDLISEKPSSRFLRLLNYDVVKIGEKDDITCNHLENAMRECFGCSPYGYEVCVVDVILNLNTPCRRRLCIPMDTSLDVFHRIIGALFEWEEYHYYNFILKATKKGIPLIIASPNPDEDMAFSFERIKAYYDSEVTLADVFSQTKKFYYEYDFGDGWEHTIKLVKTYTCTEAPKLECLEVEGLAPPEDCGGPWGFEDLKEALADKEHPNHFEMVEWYGSDIIVNKTVERINWLINLYWR